ncbi:MAG: GNAT family N-acetyltransferase [Lachnospiraceae bacterium]|nr:GNAT family N-acetyltransferase [Lachnospiraceae bacterium]
MNEIKGEYCRGTAEDTEDILDFANMVFSMDYKSIHFASLLPKAYSKERCGLPRHHMIKENGKIRALIDIYPVTMRLNGETDRELKAAYIGTVSVHPNTRGKGYMIELMKRAEEDAVKEGCALMILDGNRHRYQYYGFERAGIRYRFQAEINNIRHCCAKLYGKSGIDTSVYSFEEVDRESPYLDKLYALYQRRNMTARTKEDFLLCLQSSYAVTYAVLKNDVPTGYINLSADEKNVLEFEMDETAEFPRVIYDLMMGLELDELGFSAGMDEGRKIEYLEKMCDYCNAAMSHQIKILDYEKVLAFLLRWKQKYDMLVTNEYVLGIQSAEGGIKKYLLSVKNGDISVTETQREADAVFEPLELVRTLTTTMFFAEQQKGEKSKLKNAPQGWFPLPFYLPDADAF